MTAAKVGGIHANNTYPAQFIYDNLMMASNVIEASYRASVEKLLFLGSSCIYPKMAAQPIREDSLTENSHVIPALIRRAHEAKLSGAKNLSVWGSGTPRREFLNADDCADALVHVMKNYSDAETINIGSGTDMTIAELAQTICEVVGFEGELVFDTSKPDGTPRKLMSGAKLQTLNWSPKIALREGLAAAYADFKANA